MTSSEIWECINTTYHALAERERAAKRLGPHEFLSFIEGRAAMFAGLADSTLSRDDGYRFMVLGRAIERVDMTVRLLLSRVGDSASSPAWVTLLRSAGAHDTYLRTYRGVLDAGRVVEFMLLDRLFPRSVFYSLRLAEHNLDELVHNPQSRIGATAEAQRLLGQARSELEFVQPGVLLESLESRLAGLQRTCRDVGEALALQYFHVTPWVAWSDAGQRGQLADQARRSLMWRMRVVHTTGYAYQSPVTASYNEARLTPTVEHPAERHPQPRRNRPGDPVLSLHRLLGYCRDGFRPARAAHRSDGDVLVGHRDRAAGAADGQDQLGATCSPRP